MLLALFTYLPIYLACIGLAGLMWQRPVTLALCYVVVSAVVLRRYHRRGDLIYFFVPFFMGPVGELLPVWLGAWKYSQPLALIPLWLPFVWGLAGLFMRRVSDVLQGSRGRPSGGSDEHFPRRADRAGGRRRPC